MGDYIIYNANYGGDKSSSCGTFYVDFIFITIFAVREHSQELENIWL